MNLLYKHTGLAGLLFAITVFATARIILGTFYQSPVVTASDLSVENISAAINQERTSRNISALNTDLRLSLAADYKARDMITRKYFAHIDPDGNYIWPKIVSYGYTPYTTLGENLAIEFYSTESLVQAWMNSSTHRANILQEAFQDQGMGTAYGDTHAGEFGTSIANTFGTMLVSKKSAPPPTPAPMPQTPAPVSPEPKALPKPAANAIKPQPKPAPVPLPAPAPTTPQTPALPTATPSQGVGAIIPRGTNTPTSKNVEKFTPKPKEEQPDNNIPKHTEQQPSKIFLSNLSFFKANNPYNTYRVWAVLASILAISLLGFETKKYLQQGASISHHKINAIFMLILTIAVTILAYLF